MTETEYNEASTAPGDEVAFRRLLEILWTGKWIIVALTVICGTIGWVYGKLAVPIYVGDTLLQVEQRRGGGIPGLSMGTHLYFSSQNTAEQELLRSRMVVGRVVDQLDLQIDAQPEQRPAWRRLLNADDPREVVVTRLEIGGELQGQALRLTALGNDRFEVHALDSERRLGAGRVGEPLELGNSNPDVRLFVNALHAEPGDRFELRTVPRLAAIQGVRNRLQVEQKDSGGILEVRFQHPDRKHIENVLNALGNAYVRQNVERSSEEARRSLEFLEEQLGLLRADVEAAEERFRAFREQHRTLDLSQEANNLLSRYVEVDSQLQQNRIETSEQRRSFGAEHPRIQQLATRQQELQSIRAELDEEFNEIPEREQELLRLRREMDVNTHLYTGLLNTAQELRIAQAGTIGNVRIVDAAAVSGSPVAPNRRLTLLVSLMLGGVLGVGAVFGRELLRQGISDPEALEARLGLPVYAVVPHSATERRLQRQSKRESGPMQLLARGHPNDLSVESIRSLRTSLSFALLGGSGNVVAVTSPGPSNGKTFLTANLAWVAALDGQRVLLIDADLRRGHVHQYLEQRHDSRGPGLSEVLAGTVSLDDALVTMADSTLDVLTSGALPPNPSELMMREVFGELIEQASRDYDLVLIDSAPVLAVTDGVIAVRQAGAVLVAVRAHLTTEREAAAALRRLDQNGVRAAGLVVNDYSAQSSGYGQYRYYEYGYASARQDKSA